MAEAEVSVLCDIACELGEGPTWDKASDTLWWFDIAGRKLVEKPMAAAKVTFHELPEMGSALAKIDDRRQLLVAETGTYVRDVATGRLTKHVGIEADNARTRSNDSRVHPSGAFWIGTMAKNHDKGAGAIYWLKGSQLRPLFGRIGIPNAICFSPDGATAYFTDSLENRMMRVACDPATGLPQGEPAVFLDSPGDRGTFDGSITDTKGNIWNARWGAGALDCWSPQGKRVRSIAIPARQSSCPAYAGAGRIAVTTAYEGMDAARRAADPKAGWTFLVRLSGNDASQFRDEPAFRL